MCISDCRFVQQLQARYTKKVFSFRLSDWQTDPHVMQHNMLKWWKWEKLTELTAWSHEMTISLTAASAPAEKHWLHEKCFTHKTHTNNTTTDILWIRNSLSPSQLQFYFPPSPDFWLLINEAFFFFWTEPDIHWNKLLLNRQGMKLKSNKVTEDDCSFDLIRTTKVLSLRTCFW